MVHKIMLVEGNRLMLEQLSNVIRNSSYFELVARYRSINDALGQGTVFKPTIILLDIDNSASISILSEFNKVFPDASIICMGEKWQADSTALYVNAGARGYIIKPFSQDELKEAIDTFIKTSMRVSSRTITFFSPKGKSGKTTLIANLSMAIARQTNEQVGIIDADLQFGDMAVFFNLKPQSTIVEAARDTDFLSPISLNSYFIPITDNVSILCGTKNPSLIDKVSIKSFEALINMSKNLFRYILIDVPAGFNPTSIAAAESSDITYIVSMLNAGYEVQHVKRALEIFKDWPDCQKKVKTIFTRVEPCTTESKRRMEEVIEYPVESIIPNAYIVVSGAADNGHMALDLEPGSQLAKRINALASKITNLNQNEDPDDF